MNEFRLLVIADVHYNPAGGPLERRRYEMGAELVRRAIVDAAGRGGFDAIALMGDLIDDGSGSAELLAAIADQVRTAAPDTPVMAIPGNHDGDPRAVPAAFGDHVGLHQLGGYRFVTFADEYDAHDVCTRPESARRRFHEIAAQLGGPIVALQHNPMHPPISSEYPYMPANRPAMMDDYRAADVVLSISGHYHDGQPVTLVDGVGYYTAPALCEAPCRYAMVRLRGREADVETRSLTLPADRPAIDVHAHSQLAYCGTNVSAEAAVDRARQFGLAGLTITEHAPQLYCSNDDFWAARHLATPSLWREDDRSRMDEFRRIVRPLRDAGDRYVRVGLEVELDIEGCLTVRDEDRELADLLVGAIHWLARPVDLDDYDAVCAEFMRCSEAICHAGVDVLAHPWRFFRRKGLPTPKRLYDRLAETLARTSTAAEINFHTNEPDPAFVAACIRASAPIALGSDAHALYEVALFGPHLSVLRAAEQLAGRAATLRPIP